MISMVVVDVARTKRKAHEVKKLRFRNFANIHVEYDATGHLETHFHVNV